MNYDYILGRVKEYEEDIASVVLKGSRLDESSLDYWSDTDVVYVLKDGISVTEDYIKRILVGFGEPVAIEKYIDERCCLIRGIFLFEDQIDEWDILIVNMRNMNEDFTFPTQSQVIWGNPLKLHIENDDSAQTREYDESWIESVWYKLFASAKRICRYDNLIGLHLLLDVYRDLLVVKMIDRDVKLNTNVHRFGENEKFEDLVPLKDLVIGDRAETLNYICRVGKCFDEMMMERFNEYASRFNTFKKYCTNSIEEIE